ncbi:anti-sigma factor antagonist [candidate division KSB1 bacterium]|jgi:anti-sigma B factor antagonist|nr:anti-sigma factor antagonist [candidate division KSB1 bacterium]
MEGIQLSVEKAGVGNAISVIKVGGYIDTTTSSELEHALSSLLKEGSYNIIIDLGNVDYVSSAGWGIFISEIKGIREKGGDLKLVRMIPEVYEVFELLEFHYILKAFDTLDEAVKDFERNLPAFAKTESQKQTAPPAHKEPEASPSGPAEKSVEEKISSIVMKNPDISNTEIAKILNTPEYGNIKLGWFGMRKTLKKMGLANKKDRKRLVQNS